MSELIDPAQLVAAVKAATRALPHKPARDRLRRLSFAALIADPRCAVPASPAAIAAAPEWARDAHLAGRPLAMFFPAPEPLAETRAHARALRDAWNELNELSALASQSPLSGELSRVRDAAAELFRKLDRMDLPTLAEKSRAIAEHRRRRRRARKAETPLFEPSFVVLASGGSWRRLLSPADLDRVGQALNNCLARKSANHASYGRRLIADTARFWALEDASGAVIAVAMFDVATRRIREVRGPRNAPFPTEHPAYIALSGRLAQLYGAPASPPLNLDDLARAGIGQPRPRAFSELWRERLLRALVT